MSTIKHPRVKKQLAYADRVNLAEYPHGFRVGWPRKKAKVQRRARRVLRQQLKQPGDDLAPIPREKVRKWGTMSLRERVAYRKWKRQQMAGTHKARRLKRAAQAQRPITKESN